MSCESWSDRQLKHWELTTDRSMISEWSPDCDVHSQTNVTNTQARAVHCTNTMQAMAQGLNNPEAEVGIAHVVKCPTEKPGVILMLVWVPSAARDFSPSQLLVQTLLQCLCSPCVQPHASKSVHMLKIPNTGSHTAVWTHRNGYHCSCSCCVIPR